MLDGGVITERGTHDELVAAGGTYARMYQLQAARFASDRDDAVTDSGRRVGPATRPSRPGRPAGAATVAGAARLRRSCSSTASGPRPAGWPLVTALLVLGSVAGTCYPLGYRLLVDGALGRVGGDAGRGRRGRRRPARRRLGADAIGATEAMALSDRIAVYRTSRMIELISGVAGLEHLERPDYLAQVERLNANRRQLAAAPRQMLSQRLVRRPDRRPARAARLGVAVAAAAAR